MDKQAKVEKKKILRVFPLRSSSLAYQPSREIPAPQG
jgi:hypothetical protein